MQQLFTFSRLRQAVLAVTLWAATFAAPAGAQSTEPFNFSADIAPSVESFKMTQFGSVAPSLYTGAMLRVLVKCECVLAHG